MSQHQKNFFLNPLEKRYWMHLNELERLNKRQAYAIEAGHLDDLTASLARSTRLLVALLDLEKRMDHLDQNCYRSWWLNFNEQRTHNQQALRRLQEDLDHQIAFNEQQTHQKRQFIDRYGV